jgi:hypothetical protein
LEEDVIEEASNSNTIDETFKRELFKLFFQRPKCIKIEIPLNPPPIIATPILSILPIMAVPLSNALRIQLPKYHNNQD